MISLEFLCRIKISAPNIQNKVSVLGSQLFILFFLFSCNPKLSQKESLNLDDYIVWEEEKRLDYSDFEAKVKPLQGWGIKNAAACLSFIQIQPLFNLRYIWDAKVHDITILSLFDQKRSWFDVNHKEAYILEHEQLHFDLTEISSRTLRKSLLARLKGIPLDSLKLEFEHINKLLREEQNRYDNETEHGTKKDKQIEWKVKIGQRLEELSDYKQAIIKIGK